MKLRSTGSYEVVFDASDLTSGTYFYTLIADNSIQDTKKMDNSEVKHNIIYKH